MANSFLHCHHRFKNGKDHCYWSIAEKVRTHRGWVQKHLLYLGEINDSQKAAWTKVIEVFDPGSLQTTELALYPAQHAIPDHAASYGVHVRLQEFALRRPRQWGACWIACRPWDQLQLDEFWREIVYHDSREDVEVKLLAEKGELYVLAPSKAHLYLQKKGLDIVSNWNRFLECWTPSVSLDDL